MNLLCISYRRRSCSSEISKRVFRTNERMMQKRQPFVLDTNTFRRLKEETKVITEEERLKIENLEKAREEKLQKKRAASRAELQYYGMLRAKDPKPTLVSGIFNTIT